MKNAFSREQLELFVEHYGVELANTIAASNPRDLASRVPSTWLELIANPDASRMRAIWHSASTHLPRFIDYLSRSLQGAAMIEVHGFPVLLIALPDWNERQFELLPGFCWMGTPSSAEQIERTIADVGPVPDSLEQLWRVANFITLKEHSLLCSPDPTTRAMTEAPAVLPALTDALAPDEIHECLQIAVVNDQMVTCMTRPPHQAHWDDHLVRRFRRTNELSSAVRTKLDDKLADWTFSEWPD